MCWGTGERKEQRKKQTNSLKINKASLHWPNENRIQSYHPHAKSQKYLDNPLCNPKTILRLPFPEFFK